MDAFLADLAASLGIEPIRIVDAASGIQLDQFDGAGAGGAIAICNTSVGAAAICTSPCAAASCASPCAAAVCSGPCAAAVRPA